MPRTPTSEAGSRPGPPPLVYVGGDPSLDLVNTVDWVGKGTENERLTTYARLTRWAEGAGVVSRREAQRLRERGETRQREAGAALERAWAVRSTLKGLFDAVAGGAVPQSAWTQFNDLLSGALSRLGVSPVTAPDRRSGAARWTWRGADERLDSPLWPVIWSAARLLSSEDALRIRVCDGPGCGWVFVDRSRNHLRRWCEMKTCGTAAKTRRRRAGSRA